MNTGIIRNVDDIYVLDTDVVKEVFGGGDDLVPGRCSGPGEPFELSSALPSLHLITGFANWEVTPAACASGGACYT